MPRIEPWKASSARKRAGRGAAARRGNPSPPPRVATRSGSRRRAPSAAARRRRPCSGTRPDRPSTQCTARSMSACSCSGSYQVAAVVLAPSHGASVIALIVCIATPRSAHTRGQRLEVGGVPLVPHLHVAVREQHRVEREALEAAPVHRGDRQPVAGHADEAHEPLVARLDQRLERTAWRAAPSPTRSRRRGCAAGSGRPGRRRAGRASGGSPRARRRGRARPVFVARKNCSRCCASHGASRSSASPYDAAVSMWLMPCSSSSSRVRVGLVLCDGAERRRAEDRARAFVAGAPERRLFDHSPTLTVPMPHDVIRSATRLGATFAAYRVAGSSGDGYSTEECDARCGA